jgi:hypothetical protein
MASTNSLVPSLISAGSAIIFFLKPSAKESTVAMESEVFLLGKPFPCFLLMSA